MQNNREQAQVATMTVLTQAVELGARVVLAVAGGEEVSSQLDGEEATMAGLSDLIAARLNAKFAAYSGSR